MPAPLPNTVTAPYPVRLPAFEGPLDLLLHLLRTQKIDIWDIPIATVTDQYLEYLALMELLDLDVAGEFLVMAATLMEIKSRMLLPRPEPLPEEDEGRDPRAELVERLLEYERFQRVAEELRELASSSSRSFPRSATEQWEGGIPLVELGAGDLLSAIRRLTEDAAAGAEDGRAPRNQLRVRRHEINLRQRVAEVLQRVRGRETPLPFSSLVVRSGRMASRLEVLVTFLAILELVRLGQLRAWQQGPLGEIYLQQVLEPLDAAGAAAVRSE